MGLVGKPAACGFDSRPPHVTTVDEFDEALRLAKLPNDDLADHLVAIAEAHCSDERAMLIEAATRLRLEWG